MAALTFARRAKLSADEARAIPKIALYRQLLRAVRTYPSVRRSAIRDEIRLAFRENRDERDSERLVKHVAQALEALRLLRQWDPRELQKSSFTIRLD